MSGAPAPALPCAAPYAHPPPSDERARTMSAFIDERIYTLHAGKVPVFLDLYEREGMAVQTRILGRMAGYYYTEFGPLNQIVHMWAYDSFEDRARRRGELLASAEWRAYAQKMQPLVHHVENKLLMPAPFFRIPQADASPQ